MAQWAAYSFQKNWLGLCWIKMYGNNYWSLCTVSRKKLKMVKKLFYCNITNEKLAWKEDIKLKIVIIFETNICSQKAMVWHDMIANENSDYFREFSNTAGFKITIHFSKFFKPCDLVNLEHKNVIFFIASSGYSYFIRSARMKFTIEIFLKAG